MRRDGRRVRVLLGDDKAYRHDLDVSPDGHRLAFSEGLGSGFYLNVLRIMDLQTRRTRTIPGDCGRGVGEIPPKWVWA